MVGVAVNVIGEYLIISLQFIVYIFLAYILAKFFGRLAGIIIKSLQIDNWLKAKGLEYTFYGVKFSELVMFIVKLAIFVSLLQLFSFVEIKELQLALALVVLYGYFFITIFVAFIVGLMFGELIKQLVLKTNITFKGYLAENIKLAIAGLFVLGALSLSSNINLLPIDLEIIYIAYGLLLGFLFIPILVAYGVKEYKDITKEIN